MTPLPASQRDDGPLAAAVRRIGGVAPRPVWTALAGTGALATGLVVDGARTATGSVVGIAAFVVLGTWSADARDGRLGWIVPALLRVGEYATMLVLGWRADARHAVFALLAVVVLHHYDLVYLDRMAPRPRLADVAAGGWEGRTLVLLAAAYAGAVTPVSVVATVWIGLLLAVSVVRSARALMDHRAADGRTS